MRVNNIPQDKLDTLYAQMRNPNSEGGAEVTVNELKEIASILLNSVVPALREANDLTVRVEN
jgi:hypothetical protein